MFEISVINIIIGAVLVILILRVEKGFDLIYQSLTALLEVDKEQQKVIEKLQKDVIDV
jgi:hypothetical protein